MLLSPEETDERAGAKGSPPQEARQKRATPLTINGFRPGSFMPGLKRIFKVSRVYISPCNH